MAGHRRSCFQCGCSDLIYHAAAEEFICTQCGAGNPAERESSPTDYCTECGMRLTIDIDTGEDIHDVELDYPRCTIHKAELVARKRRAMRLVKGG